MDYYMTVYYPEGRVSGPTRLVMAYDLAQAKKEIKRFQKIFCGGRVELTSK